MLTLLILACSVFGSPTVPSFEPVPPAVCDVSLGLLSDVLLQGSQNSTIAINSITMDAEANEVLFNYFCSKTSKCVSPKKIPQNKDLSSYELRQRMERGVVSWEPFWWGWQVYLPGNTIADVGAIAGMTGGIIGGCGPAGPFAAAYVAAEAGTIYFMNRDNKGVILGGTWISNGAIIPRSGADFY